MNQPQPQPHSASNTNTPSPSDIDQLSARLASTFLESKASQPQPWTQNNGQWTHLTPGSSVAEQLRAINNNADSTTTPTQDNPSSPLATAMQALNINLATPNAVKHAMDKYLSTLTDSQLSNLMASTLHITSSTPYTHYPPSPPLPSPQFSSPLFTGPLPSYPRGSLDAIKQLYIAALRISEDPDVLLDAPLPGDAGELAELGVWMVDMCAQCEIVIRSPRGHPSCPFWVP